MFCRLSSFDCLIIEAPYFQYWYHLFHQLMCFLVNLLRHTFWCKMCSCECWNDWDIEWNECGCPKFTFVSVVSFESWVLILKIEYRDGIFSNLMADIIFGVISLDIIWSTTFFQKSNACHTLNGPEFTRKHVLYERRSRNKNGRAKMMCQLHTRPKFQFHNSWYFKSWFVIDN